MEAIKYNTKRSLFSLNITDLALDQILYHINRMNGFNFIATPNIQHIIELNNKPDLLKCYQSADLIICDSKILQLISYALDKRINNVITGSDLTKYMFEEIFTGNESIMIIGSTDKDIDIVRSKYNLTNLSHHEPSMGFIENSLEIEKTINAVLVTKPRYLFLAVGFPRQEIMACKLKERVNYDCLAFCVGASIDFLTGKQKRAPVIWQSLRMEWFYRFLHEPRRLFHRYFIQSWRIIPLVIKELRKNELY